MKRCRIRFLPDNKETQVCPGTDLLTASMKAGVQMYNSCAGEGLCGRCRVIVKKGKMVTEPTQLLTSEEKKRGYVLACRTTCSGGDMEVEIPPESRLEEMKILTGDRGGSFSDIYTPEEGTCASAADSGKREASESPLSTKIYLEIPRPTLKDSIADMERLFRAVLAAGHDRPIIQMSLSNIRSLPQVLRKSDWKVTLTLGDRNGTSEVLKVEPGDTYRKNFGICVDIGTTTIVAYLVDLYKKKVISSRASHNPQIALGEDVITRIIAASQGDGLDKLHGMASACINGLINNLTLESSLTLDDISCVVAAGNTTMIQLLLRVDPSNIRKEPYVPAATAFPVVRAIEAGIKIHPKALLACIPAVAGYVGGDITAGVLASGMCDSPDLSLFIDLGTNGEVVLGNSDWLVCCSTSAGPCFEGGGVKWGVRAMSGAVEKVDIRDGKVSFKTISGAKARGICGSGLISLLGEMFREGVIDKKGRLRPGVPGVRGSEDGNEFLVVPAGKTMGGSDIVLTEADIKNVIHSKGAIYSGAGLLLRSVDKGFGDLSRVIISGGLGTSLDVRSAIMIGLLPDLPEDRFVFIGNSSLSGAGMCLMSSRAMREASEISGRMTYIDLSTNTQFMDDYTASLFLPHTDIELFPSVKDIQGEG